MRSFYLAFAEKFSTPSRKFDLQNSPTRPVKSSELIFQAPSEKLPTAFEELQPPAGEEAASLQAVATLFPLPWSHYVRLLSVKDETARRFYEVEALRGGWSVRQLDRQIGSQFYQRTLLSRNKAAMLRKGAVPQAGDLVTPEEEIKDPLVLESLDLKDEYSEHDLEEALIRKLEDFQQVRSAKPAAQDERLMAHSSPSIQSNSPIAFAPSSCAACSRPFPCRTRNFPDRPALVATGHDLTSRETLSDPELSRQARTLLERPSSLDIPLVQGPFVPLSEAWERQKLHREAIAKMRANLERH